MLTVNSIIANIKKGQSALKVREILTKLEQSYNEIKPTLIVAGCVSKPTTTTVFLKMPSKSTANVLYDIVLELHSTDKIDLNTKFKVFSNSPSFVYNFGYVFHSQGSLLYPEKYPVEVKTQPPVTRNPFFTVGFDKHIYAAIKLISQTTLAGIKNQYESAAPAIKSFADKMQEVDSIRREVNNQE